MTSHLKDKRILVTGATGVLGSILCMQLEKDNHIHKLADDITDLKSISNSMPSELDLVIHLAAMVPTTQVQENPIRAFEVNVGGTINLITALQKLNMQPFFFYSSTSHVYKSSAKALDEEAAIAPTTLYGETKLLGEKVISSAYSGSYCIGRIFSYYHDTQKGSFLYPTIKKRLAEEDLSKPFELYGANSIRDFLTADKVCEYIAALCSKGSTGVFNIASGTPTLISDFVQQLAPQNLNIAEKGESNTLLANVSKLKASV